VGVGGGGGGRGGERGGGRGLGGRGEMAGATMERGVEKGVLVMDESLEGVSYFDNKFVDW